MELTPPQPAFLQPSLPQPSPPQYERLLWSLAGLWGLAEATLFFIVPDVLLTAVALTPNRRWGIACVVAMAGAVAGGVVMYAWGHHDIESARIALDAVPWVSESMIDAAARAERSDGVWALAKAQVGGQPYKIYAATAGDMRLSLPLFLIASAVFRMTRFVGTSLVAVMARRLLARRLGVRGLLLLHGLGWSLFYLYYAAAIG